ncbi:hypothetical protein IFT75_06950 [Pseudomonas sp. CFBP 8758]|uniref:hypothetical protein n=1 Tax=unclassified Pseudomonas TaxID=196821 RepID=UPI00177D0E61|nr:MULTISPECIES: hypothetical protein [unclassified Pseudomonas]MBD8593137.1 hypothetical protein [Pseudomonas sp. CFBP 8758]MBD8828147.1 hypothetical protein [Pseudomonas sp. CFBP 13602]
MTLLYRSSIHPVFTVALGEKIDARALAGSPVEATLEIPIGGPISLSSRRSSAAPAI